MDLPPALFAGDSRAGSSEGILVGREVGDRPRDDLELAFCGETGFFLALGGGELELLGEIVPDVIALSAKPARDAVASPVSARGRQEESDSRPQYGADRYARRKQTDIVPVRDGFVRQSVRFWLGN